MSKFEEGHLGWPTLFLAVRRRAKQKQPSATPGLSHAEGTRVQPITRRARYQKCPAACDVRYEREGKKERQRAVNEICRVVMRVLVWMSDVCDARPESGVSGRQSV